MEGLSLEARAVRRASLWKVALSSSPPSIEIPKYFPPLQDTLVRVEPSIARVPLLLGTSVAKIHSANFLLAAKSRK